MDWRRYWNGAVTNSSDPYQPVGRTFRQRPYTEKQVGIIVDRILTFLQADPRKRVLELACGNGMLTKLIAPYFESITAVDFSEPLIRTARHNFARENIEYHVGDAIGLEGVSGQYDCVLIYFALQYFTPEQTRIMFANLATVLRKPARILLGEVADRDRIWNFYRGPSGRTRYAFDLLRGKPIIGHWWRPVDLLALAQEYEMDLSVFYQSDEMPNYYFRYDALLELTRI